MPLQPVKPLGKQVSVSNKGKIELGEPMVRNVKAVETTGNTPGDLAIKLGEGKGLGRK